MSPGIFPVDVSSLKERQLAAMANLITMTPGTLGVYVSKDLRYLYIHAMYMDKSAEEMGADLARDYGERVKRVSEGKPFILVVALGIAFFFCSLHSG